MKTYDVIIIGGGITGAGTARDCALRGFRTLLIERNDISTGATGRNHGLLHSGARYAMKDAESARECIAENRILRNVASHCIEPTGGIFITLPSDADEGYGLDYQEKFIDACHACGIRAERISPSRAVRLEPSVNPVLTGAVTVPDASVDPFRLCAANVLDARLHGAEILTCNEFLEFIIEDNTVLGVRTLDRLTGVVSEYRADITINAAGIWGQAVAAKAGVKISMYPAKGTLLVFGHRVNNVVINRCRKSADGDILVPGDTVTVIGTTSTRIPFGECDDVRPAPDEVKLMLEQGCQLCPSLSTTRIFRAYSGVRPLVADDSDPTGRSISRGIVCLDHEARDGVRGLITITGGKLMTYRLMAEKATDMAAGKLRSGAVCETAFRPLPGSEKRSACSGSPGQKAAQARQGTRASMIDFSKNGNDSLVCECENVTLGEIKYAVKELGVRTLDDLRRRTRMGMGTCQGTFCIRKAASALALARGTPQKADELAREYLRERWKGMIPVAWGDTLREMEFMQRVYKEGLPYSYED